MNIVPEFNRKHSVEQTFIYMYCFYSSLQREIVTYFKTEPGHTHYLINLFFKTVHKR